METKTYSGPVTPEELDEVFGFTLIDPRALLIERIMPPEQTRGGIIIPNDTRKDRQTGAMQGIIIQIGADAKVALDEGLKRAGKQYESQPGDRVAFPVYAGQPAGLMENGFNIQSGFDKSRYSGVEIIEINDVRGHTPKHRLQQI